MVENMIDRLAGHVPEPYQKERVLAAAREFGEPFTLRELAERVGLPAHVVHRVLSRLTKRGILTRGQIRIRVTGVVGGRGDWRGRPVRFTPGRNSRTVYLYSFPAPAE